MVTKTDENKLAQSVPITGAQPNFYEIRIKGQLDESWSDWLDGLEVNLLDNCEMILCGYIRDQAALLGTLNKLYGLNLTLLSVSKIDQKE